MRRELIGILIASFVGIVLGLFALCVTMKFQGYPDAPFVHWSRLSVGLREHGHWLLLTPVIGFVGALLIEHSSRVRLLAYAMTCLGFGAGLGSLILFFYAAFTCANRSLLIQVPDLPPTASGTEAESSVRTSRDSQ